MASQFWDTVLSPVRATVGSITGTLKKKRSVNPDEYHDFATRSTLGNLRYGEAVAGTGFSAIGFHNGAIHPEAGNGLNPNMMAADTYTPPVGNGSAMDATAAGQKLEMTRQLHQAAVKMSVATRQGKSLKLPVQ